MKITMLVKQVQTKLLVSGDKSLRLVLESTRPEDIPELAELSSEVEVEVEFKTQ